MYVLTAKGEILTEKSEYLGNYAINAQTSACPYYKTKPEPPSGAKYLYQSTVSGKWLVGDKKCIMENEADNGIQIESLFSARYPGSLGLVWGKYKVANSAPQTDFTMAVTESLDPSGKFYFYYSCSLSLVKL